MTPAQLFIDQHLRPLMRARLEFEDRLDQAVAAFGDIPGGIPNNGTEIDDSRADEGFVTLIGSDIHVAAGELTAMKAAMTNPGRAVARKVYPFHVE